MKATAIARTPHSADQDASERTVTLDRFSIVPSDGASNRRAPPVHLTARQLEVLELLCEGLPNKLICRRLNISAGTVKAHISSILRELGVSSRLQAVVWARHRGLLSDADVSGRDDDADGRDDTDESAKDATSMVFLRRCALN